MRTNNFFERLKAVFAGGTDDTIWFDQDFAPPLRTTEPARDVGKLIERLQNDEPSEVLGGCVQLLGLDLVKDRLGAKWAASADRILLIAQEALEAHLGPGDIYRIVDNAAFQICFETADETYASFQVTLISNDIEERIAAEFGAAENELTVSTFVAPVPCARIRDASDPLSALYTNLLAIRDAVNTRAIKRHSIPALRYAGALFQPLWSNRDFGNTQNRCVLDTLTGAAAAKQLAEIEELEDLIEALANLDCVLFAKSIEGLHHAQGDIKGATIVVPVHYQTLALAQQEFIDIASTLPLMYRRFVLLDVIGVPTASTGRELLHALKTGRMVAERIVLQMSPNDQRLDQNARNLIWGLSITLDELDSEDPHVARELTRFALTAAEHGLHSFAYAANTIGKAVSVVEAGFDYVGGTAVSPTVPFPRSHARFKPIFGEAAPKAERNASRREHPRFAPLNPNSTVTLPNGVRHECRIPNVSVSGAEVVCDVAIKLKDYLVIGSIPSQVVRATPRGFAVRFLEIQQPSAVEIALQTPINGDKLLLRLQTLQA